MVSSVCPLSERIEELLGVAGLYEKQLRHDYYALRGLRSHFGHRPLLVLKFHSFAFFGFSFFQPCSWWMQSTRCICGMAGGRKVMRTRIRGHQPQVRPKHAGVTTGAWRWRPQSLTLKVAIRIQVSTIISWWTSWESNFHF